MIAKDMIQYVEGSSVIRAMFEEGKKMAERYGAENVYDYSLGNPSVQPPVKVRQSIEQVLSEENPTKVHGYMNNSGFEDVRQAVADSLNQRFATNYNQSNLLMTVGAAGGLNVILKTLLDEGDEVLVPAPYFGEYNNYVANYKGRVVVVPPDEETFYPNLIKLEEQITEKTKAVIVNNPNNPTGVVYSKECIEKLAEILHKASEKRGEAIYLIADEPYRELVYDGAEVPWLPNYYAHTIVGYSYSKSLSLPGERIGYLVIPDEAEDADNIKAAANVANRILGFVNAPSLMQRALLHCVDTEVDIRPYDKNRQLLYSQLTEYGFHCIKPQGAFYLFMEVPGSDEAAFVQKAKEYHLLLVPGTTFAGPGYVRISYCVDYDMIVRSLPAFEKLAGDFLK